MQRKDTSYVHSGCKVVEAGHAARTGCKLESLGGSLSLRGRQQRRRAQANQGTDGALFQGQARLLAATALTLLGDVCELVDRGATNVVANLGATSVGLELITCLAWAAL